MDDTARAEGLRVLREAFPALARDMVGPDGRSELDGRFAGELGDLALSGVFGALWTRPGLDRRSRRLVTIGILIALGVDDELAVHLRSALDDGMTRSELEEIVLHSTAYAGFPRAARAQAVGERVLADR